MLNPALFVGDAVHPREITLADGTKHVLHFREIPSGVLRRMQTGTGKPEDEDAAISKVIAASLCLADGKDCITAEEAAKLKHGVRQAIALAIADVNGIGAEVGKVSPPEATSGSGASLSSTGSAVEQ